MNKGRVLIVDDQQEILDSLGAILADEGHELIKARDGQEALHIVQSDSPDVVFLDIWIPGIDGMQTLKAIKRIDPKCSVIMMSGHGTIETAVKAIKLGATDYLEKPLNLEDVLHLVQTAISGRSSMKRSGQGNGSSPSQLIGSSAKAAALRRALENAATESGAVWLTGDKGTGKEFLARTIHYLEGKDRHSLVKVRCPDLCPDNIQDILIGKSNGSNGQRNGKMLQAAGGTLLLVRIDRLGKDLRKPLAQILLNHLGPEARAGSRGASRFRIISTSTMDAETLVREDAFPPDLADILAQRIIRLPTLRERAEDIPLFVNHFLKEAVEEFDRNINGTDNEAMDRLLSYSWPGNVKELKILIEHVVMTAPGSRITAGDLLIPGEREGFSDSTNSSSSLHAVDKAHGAETLPDSVLPLETSLSSGSKTAPSGVASPFHQQKTLRGRVVMYGQGLHSGVKTGLTISPLPPFSGILFGHITSGGTLPAVLSNVESTELSTCLRRDGLAARTIEHLMAVFHIYGLTNVLVKISGEVPIMDGSALEFCHLVESAEIITQDERVEEIVIDEPMELPQRPGNTKSMRVEPSEFFEIEYLLDYPKPVGKMKMVYRCTGPEDFKREIAPARTFGFVKDMRMMDEMGLASGGKLSNVVLLDEEKVVNPPLRFPDEFVRHKILDLIGDFYLLGRPIRGKIVAQQTGHTDNVAMLKIINQKMKIL
ncbi:MAG: UDP-3-O-acyl-N-acetylglucosamine deacetylase [Desulfomonilaceae bacterium]